VLKSGIMLIISCRRGKSIKSSLTRLDQMGKHRLSQRYQTMPQDPHLYPCYGSDLSHISSIHPSGYISIIKQSHIRLHKYFDSDHNFQLFDRNAHNFSELFLKIVPEIKGWGQHRYQNSCESDNQYNWSTGHFSFSGQGDYFSGRWACHTGVVYWIVQYGSSNWQIHRSFQYHTQIKIKILYRSWT